MLVSLAYTFQDMLLIFSISFINVGMIFCAAISNFELEMEHAYFSKANNSILYTIKNLSVFEEVFNEHILFSLRLLYN